MQFICTSDCRLRTLVSLYQARKLKPLTGSPSRLRKDGGGENLARLVGQVDKSRVTSLDKQRISTSPMLTKWNRHVSNRR